MADGVTIELGHHNDPNFPRDCQEAWQVVEEGATLAIFDSREEALAHAVEHCAATGATFNEDESD